MTGAWAQAFAPASVGNVAAGFDLLGHSLVGAGDRARVEIIDEPTVRITAVRGGPDSIPLDAARNTAGAALIALRAFRGLRHGFALEIDKGIPLGSGMGGSAASAAAALVAANALLDDPLPIEALYPFALDGEMVASGGRHGDNVAPSLIGGLVLALPDRLIRVPVPASIHCVLVHPHQVLETRAARLALTAPYPLEEVTGQSALLAQLLLGCERGDIELIQRGLRDILIEPRRAPLVPGFADVKQAALSAGALGASLSGAGPSLFAWAVDRASAETIADAMAQAFSDHHIECDRWISPVAGPGAEVIQCTI